LPIPKPEHEMLKSSQMVKDGKDIDIDLLSYIKQFSCLETPPELRMYNFDCNKKIVCDSALTQGVDSERLDKIITYCQFYAESDFQCNQN